MLSGGGLCGGLVVRPGGSCRLCCVVVCGLEASGIGAPYMYGIGGLKVDNLTLVLLTWRGW